MMVVVLVGLIFRKNYANYEAELWGKVVKLLFSDLYMEIEIRI